MAPAVFRISTENRQRRIEMDEIATVNVRNGNIKPHGDVTLTEADLQAIEAWIAERQAQLAAREVDDILRAIDHLNLTTQWAQSRATDEQLEAVTDRLLADDARPADRAGAQEGRPAGQGRRLISRAVWSAPRLAGGQGRGPDHP
jgi:hypothetical protein